jgi:hypothetical protein
MVVMVVVELDATGTEESCGHALLIKANEGLRQLVGLAEERFEGKTVDHSSRLLY